MVKTEFMELLEELDRINEATDDVASKKFWAAAKNKQIDELSFHAAYDEELTELDLMGLFNADGTFTNKGVYGKIKAAKDANPDSWAVKALSKLWALRYVDNVLFKAEEDKLAADKAEREKHELEAKAEQKRIAEEECEVLTKEYKALLPDALKLANQELLNRFLAAYNITEAEIGVEVIINFNSSALVISPKLGWGYSAFDTKHNKTKYTADSLARVLNDYFREAIKRAEAKAIAKKADSNKVIDVIGANQHMPKASCIAVLVGESGEVYQLSPTDAAFSAKKLKATTVKYLEDITEPYRVIFTEVHFSSDNRSTYNDTVSYTYYSWDSSEKSLLKNIIPELGKGEGTWSYWETEPVSSGDGTLYSTMDNIDSWAKTKYTHIATD